MQQLYPKLILDALSQVRYPGSGKNIVEMNMVEDDLRIDGRKVEFSLIFDRPTDPFIKSVVKAAENAILTFVAPDVEVTGNIFVQHLTEGDLAGALDETLLLTNNTNASNVAR